MKLYVVEYSDYAFSKVRHVTDAWTGPVCTEIKGMLESMGCQKCKIIPYRPDEPQSRRSPLSMKTSRIGSFASGLEDAPGYSRLDCVIPY